MIHGSELAAVFVVTFGEQCLVYLCTILVGSGLYLERTGVEVLINVAAVIPTLTHGAVQVDGELLHTKVVGLVVERAVETVLPKLGEGVHGITDVAGGNGGLRYFKESLVTQTGVAAPQGVYRVGIGGVGHGQSVLKHVDVG